jgi:hypothetical protein
MSAPEAQRQLPASHPFLQEQETQAADFFHFHQRIA